MKHGDRRTLTGIVINVDGTVTERQLRSTDGALLDDMYATIGADTVDVVQLCPTPDGANRIDAWVDDDGAFNSQPNWVASALAAVLTRDSSRILIGTVLLLASDPRTGASISVPEGSRAAITEAAGHLSRASNIRRRVSEAVLASRW